VFIILFFTTAYLSTFFPATPIVIPNDTQEKYMHFPAQMLKMKILALWPLDQSEKTEEIILRRKS
jgi:hypothetical protein